VRCCDAERFVKMTTKERIKQTIDGLPDDVTIDVVIERLYTYCERSRSAFARLRPGI
jgi:hypothetical protein